MEIKIAKFSGYCYGVKRAMDLALEKLDETSEKKVYSLGPLIHNDQAMKKFTDKGLIVEEDINKIEKNSTAIVRSHGLPKDFYDKMDIISTNVVDATCPFVKKIQDIVYENYKSGHGIILIGDKDHPEIRGINGWSDNSSIIINSIEDVERFDFSEDRAYIVAVQTTYKLEKYLQIEKIAKGKSINEAKKRAEKIKYGYKIEGNTLILDNYILSSIENKFRGQGVEIFLYLPKGTMFKTDDNFEDFNQSDTDYFDFRNSLNNIYRGEKKTSTYNYSSDEDGNNTIENDPNATIIYDENGVLVKRPIKENQQEVESIKIEINTKNQPTNKQE